ncbi:acyltransferase family protein [Paenibacillus dakarensis]|uniref:acyltransferase family protein n=1 Tax=Paenibacillus dakarensis TaxID=1527293 RepID=UPI000AC1A136|nr:acyltransferase family protein [Paenibacillus dakarensis]
MSDPIKKQSRYMPGLDGLRALALFGVISYHFGFEFAPGGFLGVSIFFVLSGYLITDILASQWRNYGRLDLKDFWYRRFRRLLPAMFTMLVIVVAWITIFDHSRLPSVRKDVIGAAAYISNWQFIVQDVSYFESFGPPSPLGHMWSLAVEEQFYLLWPLILLVGLYLFPRRGQMFYFIMVLAGISALTMALIYEPGTDPSRVYFGTDTRVFSLLIGSALAIVWPSYKRPSTTSPMVRIWLDMTGTAALLVVLYMMWSTDRYNVDLYQGGMFILSLAAAVVIAVLAHPASLLGKIIGMKPLRWIGIRSYGIYLWHYPILILTSPNGSPIDNSVLRTSLQITASIVLASLSWKYIEKPIKQGAIKKLWQKTRHPQWRLDRISLKSMVISCTTLFMIGIFCAGMMTSVSEASKHDNASSFAGTVMPPEETFTTPETKAPETQIKHDPGKNTTKPPSHNEKTSNKTTSSEATDPVSGSSITAIGDSVLLGVAPYLEKQLPGISIDAVVGRQMAQAGELIPDLQARGKLNGGTVIIALGTNGAFSSEKLESLLDSLSPAEQVILVNTKVPRDWERNVNTMLSEISRKYPNTTLVDWHAASKDHPEYFRPDRVHLEQEGAAAYSSLVVSAVKK